MYKYSSYDTASPPSTCHGPQSEAGALHQEVRYVLHLRDVVLSEAAVSAHQWHDLVILRAFVLFQLFQTGVHSSPDTTSKKKVNQSFSRQRFSRISVYHCIYTHTYHVSSSDCVYLMYGILSPEE